MTVTKDFLHRVFKEIPQDQRTAFLQEVLDSLEENERVAFLSQIKAKTHSDPWVTQNADEAFGLPPQQPVMNSIPPSRMDSTETPALAAASPPDGETPPSQREEHSEKRAAEKKIPLSTLSPEAVKDLSPEEIMKRVEAISSAGPEQQDETSNDSQIDKQFQKIMFEHGQMGSDPSDMRRQMLSCMGLGVLILTVLVALSAGGTKLFHWLKSLIIP